MLNEGAGVRRILKNNAAEKRKPRHPVEVFFVFRILDITPCHTSLPDAETYYFSFMFRKLPVS